MQINVRRAKPDEAQLLTDLSLRSKASNGYDDAFMAACVEELTVTKADITRGEYWIAETDTICGCICLINHKAKKSGEVCTFFIEPDRKRQGIGKLLWQKISERAKSLKLKFIYLDADPAAVPFYESMGFKIISQVPSSSIPGRFFATHGINTLTQNTRPCRSRHHPGHHRRNRAFGKIHNTRSNQNSQTFAQPVACRS